MTFLILCQENARYKSMVVLKNTAQNARYVSAIQLNYSDKKESE
jgi:hypothetical protein